MKNKTVGVNVLRMINHTMRNWPKVPFYFKNDKDGLRIYGYHKNIWDLVDRAEEAFGWGAIHGQGDPIRRLDDELSTFVIRGVSDGD